MQTRISLGLLAAFSLLNLSAVDSTQVQIDRISSEITAHGQAYSNLTQLTEMGPRLSGSAQAENAAIWIKEKLESYGLDSVTLQPMQAPHWVRGDHEEALVHDAADTVSLKLTALGNSKGTPSNGIEAQVIEVTGLKEVKELGNQVKGKIVFYNRALDPSLSPFDAYGDAVDQRSAGPRLASSYGAVGVVVRSMSTLPNDDHPHTGVTSFGTAAKPIAAAALSTHGANELSRRLKANPNLTLKLTLSAKLLPPVESHNVIGDLRGSEFPDEIVLVGGHIDSWDLATGAQDDGAGVVQSMEVLRALKSLNIRSKRTIRFVGFMSEEFGGVGAIEYAKQARLRGEKHIAATESDRGGFAPVGFAVEGKDEVFGLVSGWKSYLSPLGAGVITQGESGTDVEPLNALGATTFGYIPEAERYFHYHHSSMDRMDIVDKKDLHSGAAAMAALSYLISEKGL